MVYFGIRVHEIYTVTQVRLLSIIRHNICGIEKQLVWHILVQESIKISLTPSCDQFWCEIFCST